MRSMMKGKQKHKHTQHKKNNKNNSRLNNVRLCDEGFKLQVSSNDKEIIGSHSSLCNEAFVSLELEEFLDYYFGTKTTSYWAILNNSIVLRLQPCSLVPRGEVVLDTNQRLSVGGVRSGDFVRFDRWNWGLIDINCSQIWVSIVWPWNFRFLYGDLAYSQMMAEVNDIIKTKFLGHVMTEGQTLLLDIRRDRRPSSMFDMKIMDIIGGKNAHGNLSRGLIEKNTIIRAFPAHLMDAQITERSLIKKSSRDFNLHILKTELNQLGIIGLASVLNDVLEGVFGYGSQPLPYSPCLSLGPRKVKGVLFYGPSDTGKTLLASNMHWILGICRPKIIDCITRKDLLTLFGEAIRDDMINRCWRSLGGKNGKRNQLHIFLIENIDYLYLEDELPSDFRTLKKGMATLSTLIDRLDNILIIGMTSNYHRVRPYLLRPGRFELQIKFDLPNNNARSDVLNLCIRQRIFSKCIVGHDLDIQEIALWTYGYTVKRLKGLVWGAVFKAKKRAKSTSTADFHDTLDTTDKGTKLCMGDFYKALRNRSIKINCPPLAKGILLNRVEYLNNICPSVSLD